MLKQQFAVNNGRSEAFMIVPYSAMLLDKKNWDYNKNSVELIMITYLSPVFLTH